MSSRFLELAVIYSTDWLSPTRPSKAGIKMRRICAVQTHEILYRLVDPSCYPDLSRGVNKRDIISLLFAISIRAAEQ